MKFDEKTGEKKPESRTDEINISIERLHKMNKENNGLMDKNVERNVLLMDISVSLGLLVDICGSIYTEMMKRDVSTKDTTAH